jgi:predicted dehydrogenase
MSAPALKWGILGAGGIAHKFADAVNQHTAGEIVAAASASSLDKAKKFVADTGSGTAYGSYEELLADPNVEAVYVATTHNNHHEPALLALAAGKPLLVEKPFTQNNGQAHTVIEAARAANLFVMEAMWTRHLPHIYAVREAIARGDIGEVVAIQADHGQSLEHVERMYRADLAGGALLDLGIYPVSFAHDILGVPDAITAVGQLTETGVDRQVGMVFDYGRAQATLHTTMGSVTANTAVISGTEGRIEIESVFYTPTTMRVIRQDGTSWEFDGRVPNGFQYQAAEVARRLAAGDKESPMHTLDHTLEISAIMDEVRAQIGLVYPNEK